MRLKVLAILEESLSSESQVVNKMCLKKQVGNVKTGSENIKLPTEKVLFIFPTSLRTDGAFLSCPLTSPFSRLKDVEVKDGKSLGRSLCSWTRTESHALCDSVLKTDVAPDLPPSSSLQHLHLHQRLSLFLHTFVWLRERIPSSRRAGRWLSLHTLSC